MNCFVTGSEEEEEEDPQNECFWNNLDPVQRIWTKFGMDILLDPRNKLAEEFSFFSKSKMAAGGQRSEIGQISPHKSHFDSAFGSGSSDLDNI